MAPEGRQQAVPPVVLWRRRKELVNMSIAVESTM